MNQWLKWMSCSLILGCVSAAQAFDTGPHSDLTREALSELGFTNPEKGLTDGLEEV